MKMCCYHGLGSQLSQSVPRAWDIIIFFDFGYFHNIDLSRLVYLEINYSFPIPSCTCPKLLSTYTLFSRLWMNQVVESNKLHLPLISEFDHWFPPQLLRNPMCLHGHSSFPCTIFFPSHHHSYSNNFFLSVIP